MTLRSRSLATFSKPEHLEQGVVEGAQIGVDLLGQVPGEEAQALAGLHRRAHQQDPAYPIRLQGLHRRGHREVGLAGPRRAHAEADVVVGDGVQVGLLIGSAGPHQAAAGLDDDLRQACDGLLDKGLDPGLLEVQVDPLRGQGLVRAGQIKIAQDLLPGSDGQRVANEAKDSPAVVDLDP